MAASPLTDLAAGTAEVELVIGGMTCAACAARVQAKLNKVDGVTATVNLATERAHVTAPAHLPASDLIAVVEATGYSADLVGAELASPAGADAGAGTAGAGADEVTVQRLRRRLILALVFFVPLTDLSIVLSLFPWARFPGWQWFLVVLAAPVATWAAWACGLSSVFVVWNSLRLRRFSVSGPRRPPAHHACRASVCRSSRPPSPTSAVTVSRRRSSWLR